MEEKKTGFILGRIKVECYEDTHMCVSEWVWGGYAHMLGDHVKCLLWLQPGKIKATDPVLTLHFIQEKKWKCGAVK